MDFVALFILPVLNSHFTAQTERIERRKENNGSQFYAHVLSHYPRCRKVSWYRVFHLDSNIHSIGAGNIVTPALNRVYVTVLMKRHVYSAARFIESGIMCSSISGWSQTSYTGIAINPRNYII